MKKNIPDPNRSIWILYRVMKMFILLFPMGNSFFHSPDIRYCEIEWIGSATEIEAINWTMKRNRHDAWCEMREKKKRVRKKYWLSINTFPSIEYFRWMQQIRRKKMVAKCNGLFGYICIRMSCTMHTYTLCSSVSPSISSLSFMRLTLISQPIWREFIANHANDE